MTPFPKATELRAEMLEVMRTDETVRACWRAGLSLEQTIIELSKAKSHLISRVVKLEMIAPKRLKHPATGEILVYRCPDHLVPIEE